MDFERIARKLANKSEHPQHYHSAIVTDGNNVMSFGYNRMNCHAEVKALSQIWPNKRKGLTVYSYRVNQLGQFRNARPCVECEKYLRQNGIKKVFYTDSDGRLQRMVLK